MNVSELRDLLRVVRDQSEKEFSGLGVVVYSSLDSLPIVPLRSSAPIFSSSNLAKNLSTIASVRSEFHDGFHLITTDGKLTHVAQYFSPPIVKHARIDRSKLFGGRYLAALFGSAIEGVQLTGIVSNGFGLAVFRQASELHFEELP